MKRDTVIRYVLNRLKGVRYGRNPEYEFGVLHGILLVSSLSGSITSDEFSNLMDLSMSARNHAAEAA
ncbi:MAG: hypothetical protein Tp138OMZ00d2C19078221_17 [Prokaryotic dsDNA virus sp.]|jgi:hypothetical protein|nr:hypothetical protein [Pseudomonadales bacterium]QDP67445.1 MAG: hypothetical protein Tp138OMZ00d2C19078221_17 [Prokaryotic dsDNA virus sp.]|tara:strand:- start:336 stop:536 length:201 start_codon:yes stop_codon:yes gene_type:complete